MGDVPYAPAVTVTATPPLWTSSEVNTTGLLCLLSSLSSLQYALHPIIALSVCLCCRCAPLCLSAFMLHHLPLCASVCLSVSLPLCLSAASVCLSLSLSRSLAL
eukprot:COSAG03_NODE_898_length_5429_cov_1.947467_2_plen_104_part_00